ncbi:putative tellurium resistance membrane protein TerC [Micromonospora jinlongensis]|uniref:Putative tellurium resistance membrane protein TerC n=1 Tax=Micromonospora jinlongensis TaxID=1287877 RepID=A0A7Y9X652_9ACTN|nr:DUF3099 domain-containing protein [Micromonospora jinlongensis]NYH45648.1 putative tellurium resistance membrane protein TerC [Micromonospora jinlongensis]
MVKRQAYQPILITDASRSQGDQLTSRQRRYVLMMGIRVACIIVGAILVGANAPLLWLWLPLCALGMVLIPWLAVLLANDRPPKEEHRLANRFHRRHTDDTPPMSLTAEERPHKVIDAEP